MRYIGLLFLLVCTTAVAEDFCGFEMHCSPEQAASVVHANKSMSLGKHTREGRAQHVTILGGSLNGSQLTLLEFFDDQLYQVIVVVDPKKISVSQLSKLAERKYGASLPFSPATKLDYLQKRNEFAVTVIENDGTTGIAMTDLAMQEACEKHKLDEIGSL